MIIKGTFNGKPSVIDTDDIAKELEGMTEREQLIAARDAGAFDLITLIPVTEDTREYESEETPGMIEAIESADQPGVYHPFNEEGIPEFTIIIRLSGS